MGLRRDVRPGEKDADWAQADTDDVNVDDPGTIFASW